MKLSELFLNRWLYRDSIQTAETLDSTSVSENVTPAEVPSIPSGGAAIDINTGNVSVNGTQLTPGVPIPQSTLDIANLGWTNTCVFSITDADTVSWTSGVFTSANGVSYSINAGNTGNMTAKNYIYFNLSTPTVYSVTPTISTAFGIGKVLIATAQNGAIESTFALVQATQIIADNILANTLSAISANLGSITSGQIVVVNGGNTVAITPSGAMAIISGPTGFPTFTLDPFGNVFVASLRRNDFHWFTVFESVDGYAKTMDGVGTLTAGFNGVSSVTAGTSGNTNLLQKFVLNNNFGQFTWDKNRSISFSILPSSVTSVTVTFGMGDMQLTDETVRHIGFKIVNDATFLTMGDGTDANIIDLSTSLTAGIVYHFKIVHTAGVGAEFFINGVSKGTYAGNLPSGTGGSDRILELYHQTNSNAAKTMVVSYYDFWQAN